MSQLQKSKKIFEAYSKLKTLSQSQTGIDFEKARLLSFLKRNENYKLLTGSLTASWASFLADPEIKSVVNSVSTANRWVRLYDTYVEKFKISLAELLGADTLMLDIAIPKLTKSNVEDFVERAKSLSRQDFKRRLRFGDVDEITCEHKFQKKYVLQECKKCGYQIKEKK